MMKAGGSNPRSISSLTVLLLAVAQLPVTASWAGDVSVELDADAGFSVKDHSGDVERLRVDEATGNISRNSALFVHTTGTNNTFIGVGAGDTATTGQGVNTAVGMLSLTKITTGAENSALGDRCGLLSAVIEGNTTFSTLEMTSEGGKLYRFRSGSEQTVTESLTLAGADSHFLTLRSTDDGHEGSLNVLGDQSVAFVDVQDLHATGDPIYFDTDSVVGSNTEGWIPVPEPSFALLQAAVVVTLAVGARRASGSIRTSSVRFAGCVT